MFLAGVAYAYSVAVSDRNKAIPLLFVGTTYPVYPRYLRRYAYGMNVGAIATSNQRDGQRIYSIRFHGKWRGNVRSCSVSSKIDQSADDLLAIV